MKQKKITKKSINNVLNEHATWLAWEGARGEQADLRGKDLRHVEFVQFVLRMALLQGANFQGGRVMYTYFQGANLQDANFQHTELQGTEFTLADLRGADLSHADLEDVSFRNADLRGAKFDMNICDCLDFHGATFSPDALPWLILHPMWNELKGTVQISEAE